MKKAPPVLVLVLAALALTACGSDNGTTTEAETEAPSGAECFRVSGESPTRTLHLRTLTGRWRRP